MTTDTQSRLPTVRSVDTRPMLVKAALETAQQRYNRGEIGLWELKAAEAEMVQLRADMLDAAHAKGMQS